MEMKITVFFTNLAMQPFISFVTLLARFRTTIIGYSF